MKNDLDLLAQYREEKALVIGGPDERTGLEEFPSFKEWKLEYMKEYAETHDMSNPVSMEKAVEMLEAELADDDELLPEEDLAALVADSPDTPDEEDTPMTDETTTPAAEETPATPEVTEAPAKSKKVTKKKATVKKVAARRRPPSKAAAAQKIFDRLYPKVLEGKKTRKNIIDELVAKAELTANGAATYYQKMKKAADAG